VPLDWTELETEIRPGSFNVKNLEQRLAMLEQDPWEQFEATRAPLPAPR
jgi:DNA primase